MDEVALCKVMVAVTTLSDHVPTWPQPRVRASKACNELLYDRRLRVPGECFQSSAFLRRLRRGVWGDD